MAQTSTVNDIIGQARQGSVAAIIQVLNERLADSSIRTRAILTDGVLQLLCEAPTPEQLPQGEVVNRVRNTLESLAPKHIRKVNINSRIVREQQLLWLEEITRDPEEQLLWSELITLKQLNPMTRFWQDLRQSRANSKTVVPETKQPSSRQAYFWRGLVGGASLCLLLLLVGWTLKHRLGISLTTAQPTEEVPPTQATPPAAEALPSTQPSQAPDAFAQAVRLAEQTAQDGTTATTANEWLDLSIRWQRASDLMGEVTPEDERYEIARDRVAAYQQNSEQARAKAQSLEQSEDNAQ